MSKLVKVMVAVAVVVGGLYYFQYPQAIQALRNLYVLQNSPATKEQVDAVKARQKELEAENARLKGVIDGKVAPAK